MVFGLCDSGADEERRKTELAREPRRRNAKRHVIDAE